MINADYLSILFWYTAGGILFAYVFDLPHYIDRSDKYNYRASWIIVVIIFLLWLPLLFYVVFMVIEEGVSAILKKRSPRTKQEP